METSSKPNHIGRKISRLRELKGLKQEAIAIELGISQQAVSKLEQSETIEDEVLERIAKILGMSKDAIKNFSDEAVLNIISNTFTDFKDNASGVTYNHQCNFNPLDKLMEAIEENKKLYERLLQSEREKRKRSSSR